MTYPEAITISIGFICAAYLMISAIRAGKNK